MKLDIYNAPRDLEKANKNIETANISERNKDLISKFYRHITLNNISLQRAISYLFYLLRLALFLKKDFDKANKEDIKNYIYNLQQKNYSPLTKNNRKAMLKRFYKWLKGNDIKYPEEVNWIKTTLKRSERKLPGEGDLLTEDDIKKLIDTADHLRDKAFFAVLYESGCRIGEMCSLRIKDIKFDEYGVLISVSGKTGSRAIRLISSVSFLSNWINNHPNKDDRNSYLWVDIHCKKHEPLSYSGIHNILEAVFKRAGIKKRLNPHLFRHSRATYLANCLTEFQMNQYFGWVQGSNMPSTYVHLSGKNVDNAILELNGFKKDKEETKESKLKPKKCPRCHTINSFNNKYCSKCACILDIKTAMELEEKMKEERENSKIGFDFVSELMKKKEFWIAFFKKAEEMDIDKKFIKNIY